MTTAVRLAGLDELRAAVRGDVIAADDAGYEEARQVYNAMIDKRPALVVRCRDTADVATALGFGRTNELDIAIRGGGHNGAGLGTVDDGLVIDLSPMKWARVDPETKTGVFGAGCTLGDVEHAAHAFGLTVPVGILSTTGISGLTLGGGVGNLTRQFGLTIDSLLGVDIVLADGSFVRASEEQNEDLFWAVRGGGGNFGVVTALEFRLHHAPTVFWGPSFWPIERSAEILSWYREFLPSSPEHLNGFFAFLTVPPVPPFPEELQLKKVCAVVWCCTGSEAEMNEALQPMRDSSPAIDAVQSVPVPAMTSAFDGLYPPGDQWYWRADFVREIPDAAVARHVEFGEKLPTPQSTMHLYPIDGAASRVAADVTPWAARDAKWAEVIVGVDPDPANAELVKSWTIDYHEAVHAYGTGGAYVNFLMEEGQERVQSTYGANYSRLAEIKAKYDPENVFHVNQNIRPA